ncbi:MAG TPA: hypothetical protein VF520_08855 [Thermoleophilaceae bacterium]|jgi:fermentation-respiration switch protein FrsA (DUF1100 family)
MTVELAKETFEGRIGETFVATTAAGEELELVLSSCEETPYGTTEEWQEAAQRTPFSLVFHDADADASRFAPQQIFPLRHPELGDLELFLVPLGPDERGMQYEAVIS